MNKSLLLPFLIFVVFFSTFRDAELHGQEFSNLPTDGLSALLPTGKNWSSVGGVAAVLDKDDTFRTEKGTGILVNQPTEKQRANLATVMEHGDIDLELEFMMSRHSNSGIYLQGRYELQLLDSWGVQHPGFGDCGGIYERWDDSLPEGKQGYQGYAPRMNACRAPGLWQKLEVSFQAPRFDSYGHKTANARLFYVKLNGVLLHENLELTGPTRGGGTTEGPLGPLLIQGDHGAIAFRNIRYRTFGAAPLKLEKLRYELYETREDNLQLEGLSPKRAGESPLLTQEIARANEGFALRFRGELLLTAAGRYDFSLNAFGWGSLAINGQPLLGPGRNMRAQSITLPAGSHQLEVRYAKQESWYANGLGLFVAGPGLRRQALHAEGSLPPDSQAANPIYAHFQPEPAVLRSFIDFQGPADSTAHRIPHAISVGFPERVSYSYNLQSGALFQVWKSGFLDVTPMWHSRGDGSARPMGSVLPLQDAPALALLPSALAPWPLEVEAPAHFRPGGYRLDEKRQPTFYYEAYNMKAADQLTPAEGGKLLERKIELLGEAPPGLYFRLAAGQKIDKMPNNTYAIDQRYYIKLPEKVAFSPILRDVQGGQELLVLLEGIQVVAYQLVW